MRSLFLVAIVFLHSSMAFGYFTEKHEELCLREEVRLIQGAEGSCRILLVPLNAYERNGSCTGKMGGVMPCILSYAVSSNGVGSTKLSCDDINQSYEGTAFAYQAVALVSNNEGVERLVKDENTYLNITVGMLEINVVVNDTKVFHDVGFNFYGTRLNFEDLYCL